MNRGRRLILRCSAALLLALLVGRRAVAENVTFVKRSIELLATLPGIRHLAGATNGALPTAENAVQLHTQIVSDGASGQTVELSGWVVSRSEAILYEAARRKNATVTPLN